MKIDQNGLVSKPAEKEVISTNAAVGLYYFKSGKNFVKYAESMIESNERTKNEFYICPLYNRLIKDELKVRISQVDKMHVLGTPEELNFFVDNVCYRFGEKPIALCADHSGYQTKELTKTILDKYNIPYIDFGTHVGKDADYNDFLYQAVEAMHKNVCDFGMGFCRTGQGINIAANKFEGIRAALIHDTYTAEMSKRHNCANFFSIPEKYVGEYELDQMIVCLWTQTFDGGRHMTRISKTMNIT